MQKYHVKLTFTEPILGTVPKDPEVYKNYIASQAALTDEALAGELATVERIEEKGWTGFHKVDGQPILYDYVLKGFLKDACSMLKRDSSSRSAKMTAFKKIIDGLVFIEPRQIRLDCNGGQMGVKERPLRAQTAQGERVTLARSDTCPAGTTMEFDVILLGSVDEKTLVEWLDYGRFRGLGQWRSASWGRFGYEIQEVVA